MRTQHLPVASAAILVAAVTATFLYAAAPPAPQPDLKTMSLPELLAEFHNNQTRTIPEPQRRVDLYNTLRHAGAPLLDLLRKDLADPDPKTARNALYVIAYLGNTARPLVPQLLTLAESKDPDLRSNALSILCRLRDPRAFDLITRAAHDPSEAVRITIVPDGPPALADARFAIAVNALSDPDDSVRHAAIDQLTYLNDKRAVAYLAPLLDDAKVLHNNIINGIKTTHRNCDNAARALEYLVNGKYLVATDDTQEQLDARVQQWQTWRKEKLPAFDAALYAEPDLQRSLE